MNNILAAKVLISHLPEITDGAYKRATEIAVETLFEEAERDYSRFRLYEEMSIYEYLELSKTEYDYWVNGKREKDNF